MSDEQLAIIALLGAGAAAGGLALTRRRFEPPTDWYRLTWPREVDSDNVEPIEYAHRIERSTDKQRLSNSSVGNRVIVSVEADVGRPSGTNIDTLVGDEGIVGQWQEPRLLVGKYLGDGAQLVLGAAPNIGDVGEPA